MIKPNPFLILCIIVGVVFLTGLILHLYPDILPDVTQKASIMNKGNVNWGLAGMGLK